ncbi:MAG: amino acid ABC transporter permease [Deferribacteraceae bacterium]|jgi:polar amino acid transport system permease protein|nr:amino acid ABC transporter permease [Deferribacteraceae bacterium]
MDVVALAIEFWGGTVTALEVFFLTLFFALPLGLVIAMGRMSHNPLIRVPIYYYILFMRGTPLLLQLIIVFYAPSYIFGINLNRFSAAILAYVLNYAAYFSEIFRGGIQSIPVGQYEAAQVLGFNRRTTFMRIVLPQVVKRITLPMSNEFTTLIKDTALISTLAIVEVFRIAKSASSASVSIVPLFVAGGIYLTLNACVTKFFVWFEKKQDYYR